MNLRDLTYLIAVAEQLHFGKAADYCHVSQPTLSMQIKKLEEYLGVTIFERTNKQVMLTPDGQQIIQMARGIVAAQQDLVAYARSCRDPFAGTFRLGAFPTIAPYFLPRIVAPITQAMPNLQLLLLEEKSPILIEKLLHGQIDAAILALPVEHDTLESILLFEDRFQLAVPRHHRLAHHKTVSMADILDEPLLLLEDGHCMRHQALQVCQLSGAKENSTFRATSLETLRQMVVAGSGITLIPEIAIDDKQNHAISYIPFAHNHPSRSIGMVWRHSTPRKPAIEALCRHAILAHNKSIQH